MNQDQRQPDYLSDMDTNQTLQSISVQGWAGGKQSKNLTARLAIIFYMRTSTGETTMQGTAASQNLSKTFNKVSK